MKYTTTKLKSRKSYPTYQFHTLVKSDSLGQDDIFKFCVLEVFKWLRSRMANFNELPDEIMQPEPEQYKEFDEKTLCSFIYNNGMVLDVVYIEKKGVWSFSLTEGDMGANIGKEDERPAVNGRSFSTEVAFVKNKACVEAGIRIICSEPADCTAPCEGFRPSFVKEIGENENIYYECEGYVADGKPLELRNKNDMNLLSSLFDSPRFDMPIILVAEPPLESDYNDAELRKKEIPTLESLFAELSYSSVKAKNNEPVEVKFDQETKGKIFYAKNVTNHLSKKNKVGQANTPAFEKSEEEEEKRLPCIDINGLAKSFLSQAVIFYVYSKAYKLLKDKKNIDIEDGDVLVFRRGSEIDSFFYDEYAGEFPAFEKKMKKAIRALPKHKNYYFGGVGRHSEMKLLEMSSRKGVENDLEARCARLEEENETLRGRIQEINSQIEDGSSLSVKLQQCRRDNEKLKEEIERKEGLVTKLEATYRKEKESFTKAAEKEEFLKKMYRVAAKYPTKKDKLVDWIRNEYSGNIYVAKSAESSMKKYGGMLDITMFCDAVVYLNAYADYQMMRIDKAEFERYSWQYGWTVDGCGKETLRNCTAEYTVSYEGKQGLMEWHLKSGTSNGEMLRIYFLWDKKMKKVVIGYMPDHLPTRKDKT